MRKRIALWPVFLAAIIGVGIGVRIQYVHDQPYIDQAAAARAQAEKLQREAKAAIAKSEAHQAEADLAKQAAESAKAQTEKAAQAARAAELRAPASGHTESRLGGASGAARSDHPRSLANRHLR